MHGGWGWVVVFTTFMIHVITDGIMYSSGIFYVEFLKYFKSSCATTSLVMSILIGTNFCIGPIASALVNNYGCRTVSLIGTLFSTVGLILSIFMPEVEYLILTVGILVGAGIGLMFVPSIVSLSCHFVKKRAFALGLSLSGSGFGITAFAPLIGWLLFYYSNWQGVLLILSGLTLNCAVFSMFYASYHSPTNVAESVTQPIAVVPTPATILVNQLDSSADFIRSLPIEGAIRQTSMYSSCSVNDIGLLNNPDIFYGARSSTSETRVHQHLMSQSILQTARKDYCSEFFSGLYTIMNLSLFSSHVFKIFFLSNFIYNLGIYVPYVYTIHRVEETGIATPEEAKLLMSTIGLATGIGRILIGLWVDKFKFKKLSVYEAFLVIVGISTLLTPLITEYYQMAIYCVVYGITSGSTTSLLSIVLVELLDLERLTNSFGLTRLSTGVAVLLGTPLTGWLYDITHSYDAGFCLTGTFCLASWAVLLLIPIVERKWPQVTINEAG